ncbi:hypothetical protein M8J75_006186 [Diaphorina citri]|nr:hypothetical protein M8J75_008218 [Diaphorina citri]KAI5710160.1 hypothetical protein M8J75_006186 [Diaphorina citri]
MMDDTMMDGGKPPDPEDPGSQGTGVVGSVDATNAAANGMTNLTNHTVRPKVLYDEEISCNTYKVLIQANKASALSYHKLGQELSLATMNSSEILFKEKLSRDKVLVACTNAKRANNLVNHETLSQKYNVFIPQNYVSRSAIIRDIDTDISEDDILQSLETRQFKLMSVSRLNRRTVDQEGKVIYVPSKTMKLNFAGQDIPANVFLWYSKITCEPFIQATLQCFKCMKFGHITKKCRAKFEVCKMCYQVEKEDHICQPSVIKCLNCDGLHNPKSKSCPELQRQKDIKALMSTRNLCFQEAAKIIPSSKQAKDSSRYAVPTSNSFNVLSELNENFPMLNPGPVVSKTIDKYVPPPLPYKSNVSRPNRNTQSGKKTLKRDSRPDVSFSLKKKVRNEVKEKQENTVAPLFYKFTAQRREEEGMMNSQSSGFSFAAVTASGLTSKVADQIGSSPVNTQNTFNFPNQNPGKSGVGLVGPNIQKIRNMNSNSRTRNFIQDSRFVFNSNSTVNFSDEDSSDLMDINPASPHLG